MCAGAKGGENMAEVKVKVLEGFNDREDNLKYKKKDSILTVTEERASKLVGLGLVERIEEVKKPKTNNAEKEG